MKETIRAVAKTTPENNDFHPVPPAMLEENKSTPLHNRSHAAHRNGLRLEPQIRPVANPLHGPFPVRRKQP